jgi:hypothetical protein
MYLLFVTTSFAMLAWKLATEREDARAGVGAAPPAAEVSPAQPRGATGEPIPADDVESAADDGESAEAPESAPSDSRPADVDEPVERGQSGNDVGSAVVSPVTDLNGAWNVVTSVESSALSRYEGLQLGYRLRLEQQGNRVRGEGRKWSENGRALAPRVRTPITVEGTVDASNIRLQFTERGARRVSRGTFVLRIVDEGTLQGSFTSDAARSEGSTLANRLR